MDQLFGQNAVFSPLVQILSMDAQVPEPLAQAIGGMGLRMTHAQFATDVPEMTLALAPDLLILACPPLEQVMHLVRLMEDAARIHCPVLLSVTLPVLDDLPESLWAGCHAILIDPDSADYAASISVALSSRHGILSDISRDVDAARLQRLADEVGRIARTLASLSAQAPLAEARLADMRPGFFGEPPGVDHPPNARDIREMIRMRRLRDRFFDASLFADPAWDMLLDLMAARLEGVQVAVSSLCIAAAVPPTTALRWIKLMTDNGLFERVSDPVDGRRVFIRLSDNSAEAMTRYLGSMRWGQGQVI
ncbi:MAG: MarR family transcriptional regulator [Alphaproteobacteria bacterium]|nr:MarR family transcriptional regulator [Alphaproteobacteria bacterium]